MHLLATRPGRIDDGAGAIDLAQRPGDIVFLSAADTELACLAAAQAARLAQDGAAPSLRLANLLQLSHNLSVDLYVETIVAKARLVVLRLLGGQRYWSYGLEQVAAACKAHGIPFAAVPGDDQPDAELMAHSTLPVESAHRLWQYLVHGGSVNAAAFLDYAAALIGHARQWREPQPLMRAGLYWPGAAPRDLDDLGAEWTKAGLPDAAPVVGLVFYRALLQAGDLAAIDALIAALGRAGQRALPIYLNSLKDAVAADLLRHFYARTGPALTLNCTAFATAEPGAVAIKTPFGDGPVLQLVLASGAESVWEADSRGLGPRDLAMHVVLPEVDGRIFTRAVSFKSAVVYDPATQCNIARQRPLPDRVDFVAALAARWIRLRNRASDARKIAVVLANYPNRDGRIANGVGLDTPAGTLAVLRALAAAGYAVADMPENGDALMARLLAGRTNAAESRDRAAGAHLSLAAYRAYLARLPQAARAALAERWGEPENDPFFAAGVFHLPLLRLGAVWIGIQPARGYNIDPAKTYHDPDLVPPHGYLAFYAWLREVADIDAVVHMGKHGNLEWLPGKALALSATCWPEIALGPLPHLYPFIVNDPGEGSQAKRRAGAVIVDHLIPPLTRAEAYGPLRDLELLIDEYYEASQLDPRRCADLGVRILESAEASGLAQDCGVTRGESADAALFKLDNHLCELKEMQIRDGLHIFGEAPQGDQLTDLLLALVRLPRGRGAGADASLIRALAADLGLDGAFDPLNCTLAEPWRGPRPAALAGVSSAAWRSCGDTIERLECLARALIGGQAQGAPEWTASAPVLAFVADHLRPMVAACGTREIAGLLDGLAGRFVQPGPSGAPSRGRLDVLPTGRNFYSVDTRAVPTPAAWALGWKSAMLLLERHRQEHGAFPKALVLSAWGTANMRTGGDDIAQALAFLGVRPVWEMGGSGRVTSFEILPLGVLGRPRVDVTLRISGFFRDAFPAQIDLFDSAVRAVAALDEPVHDNPVAARYAQEKAALIAEGAEDSQAARRAGYRVFGAKPGAYGAGLQALIDERGWRDEGDLARAYLAWGGYAYGAAAQGRAEQTLFAGRIATAEAVIQNQDNREHDLLDSDDYYQFEGGLAATVRHLTGRKAVVWHNDHSRPEAPRVRSLEEEIARVVRARVVNPKWIAGVMRHGYKGAFEMAATVDYLFAFAATAEAVSDHHFDLVFDAYLGDERVRDFIAAHNPAALCEIAARLLEAQERGLWRPRLNTAYDRLRGWAMGAAACAGKVDSGSGDRGSDDGRRY